MDLWNRAELMQSQRLGKLHAIMRTEQSCRSESGSVQRRIGGNNMSKNLYDQLEEEKQEAEERKRKRQKAGMAILALAAALIACIAVLPWFTLPLFVVIPLEMLLLFIVMIVHWIDNGVGHKKHR